MNPKPDNLTEILLEIFGGSSVIKLKGRDCFIKHPTLSSEYEVEKEYLLNYEKAIQKKLLTNEQIIERSIKQNVWSEDNEAKIKTLSFSIDSLKKLKTKNARSLSLDDIDSSINEKQKELDSLSIARNSLLDSSAENYANRKCFNYKIYAYFFNDKECTKRLFDWKEYCELEKHEIFSYYSTLVDVLKRFSQDNLKWCAFSNDFLLDYSIYENSPGLIFGGNALNLTYYQKDVIIYAKRIYSIINSGHNIPKECYANPDLLLNYNPQEYEKRKANTDKTNRMFEKAKLKGEVVAKEEID